MARNQNPAVERAKAVFAKLSLVQRVFIGAGIVTALLGVFLLSSRTSTVDMAVLYTDLKAADASEITNQLASQGVSYELADSGATVMVPRSEVYQLRLDMSGQGLPAANEGYSLLDKQGITTSEFKQQVDFQRAMEGELAKTIEAIDGVDTAIVHLALSQDTVFVDNPTAPTASVLVRTTGQSELTDETVQGMRHLVASSVKDLTPENVTITDAMGRRLGADGGSGAADKVRSKYESDVAANITTMIARVIGPDRVHVTVAAELNLDEKQAQSETFARPEGTRDGVDGLITSENGNNETYAGATPAQTGLLGPDGSPIQDSTEGAVNYDKNALGKDYALDRTITTTNFATGTVKKLSVAVALDETSVTEEQAAQVQTLVAAAAGVDEARGDSVVVTRLPFDTRAVEEITKAEEDAASQEATARMLGTLRTGLLALLALLGMFLAYRSVRRARQVVLEEIPPVELERAAERPADATVEAVIETEDDVTRRNVEEFADRSPEQTAQLMRTWMNEK
jgi:flagellar M-ring protein FliF